jgi:hypothetical protein
MILQLTLKEEVSFFRRGNELSDRAKYKEFLG